MSRNAQPTDRLPEQNPALLPRRRRRQKSPPIWLWIVLAVCAALVMVLRIYAPSLDRQIVNIATLVIGFIGFMSSLVWFSCFSAYSQILRRCTLVAVLAAAAVFVAIYKVDQVSGVLIPSFRLRWTANPDQLLETPEAPADSLSVDLLTTTDHDFPQFLGPNRDLSVAGIQLERDWRTHPPRLLWRQPIGAGWSAFSVVNGFALTMEQRGDDEMVSCYEVNSGKLRWWHSIPARHSTVLGGIGPRSTPTIHEGRVYALGATGVLRCLDGATGKPVWPSIDLPQMYGVPPGRDTDAVAWGRAASPLIVDDLVVVPAGGPQHGPHVSLVAFDMHTGDKVWEGGTRQISYASPSLATIDGQRQILIVNEDTVSGHDPSTGQLLWQFDWPGSSNTNATVSQAVAMPGDRVLLSKAYGGGAAMLHVFRNDQRWSVDELWRDRGLLKTKFCNVAVKDHYVYGLSDGILECVDASTGRRQWKKGRYGHGQVLLVDDVLLVQAESGEVLMVEANPIQHTELGRFQAIEGKTWNNLCLSGRYLLVRNALEAACYKMALVENRTLQKRSD